MLDRHVAVRPIKDGSCEFVGLRDLVLIVYDDVIMPPSARTTVGRHRNAWRLASVSCLGFCFRKSDVPLVAPY